MSLLHDTTEDSNISPLALQANFGTEIAARVTILTRSSSVVDADYYRAIARDTICATIKLCDRINNLQCAGSLPRDLRSRYQEDTLHFLLPAAAALDLNLSNELVGLLAQRIATKFSPADPIAAAKEFGGVTFEPRMSVCPGRLGWWTYTPGRDTVPALVPRCAVYLPTIQKNGTPVSTGTVSELKARAAGLGLRIFSQACGMWTLGDDPSIPAELRGTIQAETIWIACGEDAVPEGELRALAEEIRKRCNQDCVAYEVTGHVGFFPGDPLKIEVRTWLPPLPRLTAPMRRDVLLVVPRNDGEAVEAINLGRAADVEVLVSEQPWGASWVPMAGSLGLEPELYARIREWQRANPGGKVVGFELRGENSFNAINIDHHPYSFGDGRKDDRSHSDSSLRELAGLLGVRLTPYQQLVASNRAGDLAPLREEVERQGIRASSPIGKSLVSLIRIVDRCSQGVTPDDEAAAIRDLNGAERLSGKVLSTYSTPSWTPHADRLFADEAVLEHLHRPSSGDGRWVYYGPRRREFVAADFSEAWWTGGGESFGYFGIVRPGPESQRKLLRIFWEKERV